MYPFFRLPNYPYFVIFTCFRPRPIIYGSTYTDKRATTSICAYCCKEKYCHGLLLICTIVLAMAHSAATIRTEKLLPTHNLVMIRRDLKRRTKTYYIPPFNRRSPPSPFPLLYLFPDA